MEMCTNSCIMHRKESLNEAKVWRVQNVHNLLSCPWNRCRAFHPTLSCRLLFNIYQWKKENPKHRKHDIFSVISLPVYTIFPTKIHIARKLYPELYIMPKKGHFHDTPVHLVQNLHWFASCSVMLHSSRSENTINMTFSVYFPYLCE